MSVGRRVGRLGHHEHQPELLEAAAHAVERGSVAFDGGTHARRTRAPSAPSHTAASATRQAPEGVLLHSAAGVGHGGGGQADGMEVIDDLRPPHPRRPPAARTSSR